MNDLWEMVGVDASWQITDLSTGDALGEHVDDDVPLASLSKLVLALVACRLADRGALDLTERVTLTPDKRVNGTTGVAGMRDPVTLSLRDAAYLAVTISDNAAGDALYDRLPTGVVSDELSTLGLDAIRISEPMRDLYDRVQKDAGTEAVPSAANVGTPQALVDLLRLIWADEAASAASCSFIRELMYRQVWQHRLASGFPAHDIAVAGKTATAGVLRHEIGVVTYPGPRSYAVAILTRAHRGHLDHRTDHAIGEAARRAILQLRRGNTQ